MGKLFIPLSLSKKKKKRVHNSSYSTYCIWIKWGYACKFLAPYDTIKLSPQSCFSLLCPVDGRVVSGSACRNSSSFRGQCERRAAFCNTCNNYPFLTLGTAPTDLDRRSSWWQFLKRGPCSYRTENEEENSWLQATTRKITVFDCCWFYFYIRDLFIYICIYFSKLVF